MTGVCEDQNNLIVLTDVSAKLKAQHVLKQVSVSFNAGELTCLVGPNGAGKTSLLRAGLGLLPLSSGSVHVGGHDMEALSYPQRARRIAYMAQGAPVHWPLCVRKVVELGRVPHHHAWSRLSSQDFEAVQDAMNTVQVTEFGERLITKLSGGEKARVMLARALAVGAPAVFADEPVASLDPRYQLEIMDVLDAEARAGKTVVVVMHDLALASRYADQVVVMDAGKIEAMGPAVDVLSDGVLKRVFGVAALRDQAGMILNLTTVKSIRSSG